MQQTGLNQHSLDLFVTTLSEFDASLLLVDCEIAFLFLNLNSELGNEPVYGLVELRTIFCRARDDEWRSGLINKNGVHLIDNSKRQVTLAFIALAEGHIVAKIVKTKFVVGPINNVTCVGGPLFLRALS